MRSGLSKPALSSVFFRYLELVAMSTSSAEEDGASSLHESMTIRTLDQRWTLQKYGFARAVDIPYGEVVLADRDYRCAAFQDCITADDGSCNGAYALLFKQREDSSQLISLLKDSHLLRKKFYSTYRSEQNVPEARKEGKARDGMLLIPRYVRSSASIHRLAIVNILENKDRRGVVHNCLQLSYEDVPSQCRSSALFKPLQAEVLKGREESYGTCARDHVRMEKLVDSDGATNVVRLAVATALTKWLGQGACAQVGRGGYSTGHKGMVHAFLLLTPESSRLVKSLMDESALGTEEMLKPGESRGFVQTINDAPQPLSSAFSYFLRSISHFAPRRDHDPEECSPRVGGHTYRAIVSNHRQSSACTLSDKFGSVMTLLPTSEGFMTVGTLDDAYCVIHFGKHTKNTISSHGSEMLPSESSIKDSPHYRVMRHRAAFEELTLDVDAANAEAMEIVEEPRQRSSERETRVRSVEGVRRAYEKARRASVLSQLKDEAAEKMADAEKRAEEGAMSEVEYVILCNDLKNRYGVKAKPACY